MASQRDWPPLQVGAHLTSDDGVCLMELVSLTAGEPFGDRPSCTHPLVSHLARRVNDATSDRRRSELTIFIPALAAANTLDASSFAAIAAACTRVALERKPSMYLKILNTSAVQRSRPTDRRRHWLYIHGAAYRSVDLAVFAVHGLPAVSGDQALRLMLSNSLEALEPLEPVHPRRSFNSARGRRPSIR
jgi:hypothetical protein